MNAEQEKEKVIRTEPLGSALATTIDAQDQSEHGLALFRERARVAKEQLKIALTLVQPGQFVVMSQTDKTTGEVKESIYATGGAADRILRMGFGMRWGAKTITLSKDPDGTPIAIVKAPLLKHGGEQYEEFEGRRRMGGFVKTEADLIKGAIENMKHQAVTDLLGLRFLTPSDLLELGLDTSKLPRRADFQDRGGEDLGAAVVPWGKKKGTPITDLEEKELEYYAGKARETVADPAKARFKAKEERWLKALEAEIERRKSAPAAQVAEQEQLEQLIVRIREEAAALEVDPKKLEDGLKKVTTVAQAEKWLEQYRSRRAAAAAKPASEPGSQG